MNKNQFHFFFFDYITILKYRSILVNKNIV